jgi:hypothetical protein
MNQTAIFAPFLTMMLLTLTVWFYMYSKRIPLIRKSKINPNALTAAELAKVDETYLIAAWVFVGFRILHSAVHCTINIVMLRFWLYCISSLALWFMVVRAAWSAL